ncbi:hypothetical protein [Yoonia maritima]|nr:hypothetical protein [Yoonia maritima]
MFQVARLVGAIRLLPVSVGSGSKHNCEQSRMALDGPYFLSIADT